MPIAAPSTAFTAIYDEHFGFVWAVLRRLGVGDADLDDVVQEVFIVVHRRLPAFEARASVRTWLYAITVRVFWNHARRRRSEPAIAETSASRLVAFDGDPERFAEQREAGGLLQDLLGKLDPAKRTVFVLAELEGLTAPEIAEITGANQRTVYSRLRAARSSFATGLARVQARERNDALVGAHARELTRHDRPPAGAQQRTWAALLVQIAAEPTAAIAAAGLGATLQAVGLSLGIGVAALGVVYAVTIPVRATEPAATRDRGDDTVAARAGSSSREQARSDRESIALAVASSPAAGAKQVAKTIRPEVASGQRAESDKRRVAAAPASDATAADDVVAELDLMKRAREALRAGDPDRGLRLLDEHARRFPDGKLAPERSRSRVTALCSVGRATEADALAQTLALPTPVCEPKP